jgi:hypothetical protein
MTFAEWVKTGQRTTDVSVLEESFGYPVLNAVAAILYKPGAIAELPNGEFFTHIGRSEYTGTREEIEKVLWEEYAEMETK